MDEIYSPDFVLHVLWQNVMASGSGDQRGPEPAKKVIAGWRDAVPDIHVAVDEQLAEGDVVVSRHTSAGTGRGRFMGTDVEGKYVEMSGITFTRVDDSKIVEAWSAWDMFGLLQKIDVIPPLQAGAALATGGQGTPSGAAAESSVAKETSVETGLAERNKRVVQRFYEEMWNEGNLEVADEVFSPEFVGHAPGDLGVRGPDGVKGFVQQWRDAFPDLHIAIEAQYAEGERVGTRFRCTGTHEGDLFGIPPTYESAVMYGAAITRVVDEKVVSDWGEFDILGTLQQLGIIPTDESSANRE